MFQKVNLKITNDDAGIGHKTLNASPSEKRQMWQQESVSAFKSIKDKIGMESIVCSERDRDLSFADQF